MTEHKLVMKADGTSETVPVTSAEAAQRVIDDAQEAATAPYKEMARIEATIKERWVRAAALGDAYAISKLNEIESLLDVQRAKLK